MDNCKSCTYNPVCELWREAECQDANSQLTGGLSDCPLYKSAATVITLPCKFQRTVWVLPTIENNLPELTKMKCIGFMLSCDSYTATLITDKKKLYQQAFGRFGKTVFLTKEEAEQALKERGCVV